MSPSSQGGGRESVVLVAVRAEGELSKTALAWALTHIVRPGDLVTLLAVLPDLHDSPGKGGRQHLHYFYFFFFVSIIISFSVSFSLSKTLNYHLCIMSQCGEGCCGDFPSWTPPPTQGGERGGVKSPRRAHKWRCRSTGKVRYQPNARNSLLICLWG